MSLKTIMAALKQGDNEHPFELAVAVRDTDAPLRGAATLTDGLLVLTANYQGSDVVSFIEPDDVVGVSVFVN